MPPKPKRARRESADIEMKDADDVFESATLANALPASETRKAQPRQTRTRRKTIDPKQRDRDESAELADALMAASVPEPRKTRKRKSPDEYSNNANTVKARKNAQKIDKDPFEHIIRLAKARDQMAVTRAYNKLRKTTIYQNTSFEGQKGLLAYERERVMAERKANKADAKTIAMKLGKDRRAPDPNDPNWDDVTFSESEEEEEEMLMQEADEANEVFRSEDPVIGKQEEFVFRASRLLPNAKNKTWDHVAYKLWRKGWIEVYESLTKKLYFVNNSTLMDLFKRLPVWYDESGRLFPVMPPHVYFEEDEKKLWRNLIMWSKDFIETDSETKASCNTNDINASIGRWHPRNVSVIPQPSDIVISLPGPAEWWEMDEGYSATKAGFYCPTGTQEEYERVFYMVSRFRTLPSNGMWNCIDYMDAELRLRW